MKIRNLFLFVVIPPVVVALGIWGVIQYGDWRMNQISLPESAKQYRNFRSTTNYQHQWWYRDPENQMFNVRQTLTRGDYQGVRKMADELLAKKESSPLYRLMAIDAAIMTADEPRVRELLGRYRGDFEKSGDTFLKGAPRFYEWWLNLATATKSGGNVGEEFWKLFHLDSSPATEAQLHDFAAKISNGDFCIPLAQPYFLNDGGVGAIYFLNVQTANQLAIARATFLLLDGEPGDAAAEMQMQARFAAALMRDAPTVMARGMGAAAQRRNIKAMRLVYLDGFTDADALAAALPELDHSFADIKDVGSKQNFAATWQDMAYTHRDSETQPTFGDKERDHEQMMLAEFALLHSAAASRLQFLKTGAYPATAEGLDEDPFDPPHVLRIKADHEGGWAIYSIGPDKKDDAGAEFDLGYNTGDLVIVLTKERHFPFPAAGEHPPATRDELVTLYPIGLPGDPFDQSGQSLLATDDKPPVFVSRGIAGREFQGDELGGPGASQSTPGASLYWPGTPGGVADYTMALATAEQAEAARQAVIKDLETHREEPGYAEAAQTTRAMLDEDRKRWKPAVTYDPTNGIVSPGLVYSRPRPGVAGPP